MNSQQNQNMPLINGKLTKTYNLAIQFSSYEEGPKKNILNCVTNTYRLPRIADVEDQDNTNRKKSPAINIFQSQKPEIMKTNQLMNEKSFNIVGKKEVKSYQNKIIKKRNILQRRNQSALSLSRYSSSGKSQNQTGIYMNKQDLLGIVKIGVQQPGESKNKKKTNCTTDKQEITSTLRKAKSKLNLYQKFWDGKKINKSKYPSILQQISEYRRKVEEKQQNQLKENKNHMKQKIWIQTLRSSINVATYYKNSFITKIEKHGLALKGKQKLKQQLEWIENKDRLGYNFTFFQPLKQKQTNQQKRIGSVQSVIKRKLNKTVK